MSLKLHPVKILKKQILNKDAAAVYFDIPPDLKEIFSYTQGQFLSLHLKINGEDFRREYSLCSSPYCDEDIAIASKKIGGGIVSNYIYNDLKEGDVIEVYPPQGKFYTELNETNEKYYFLTGGGSGITPLLSILKSVLFKEPKSKVILYYGSADEEGIMFRDELIEIQKKYGERFRLVFTINTAGNEWKGLTGIVNSNDLLKLVKEIPSDKINDTEFFICGPAEMMENVKKDLTGINIEHSKIHIEYFTAPAHHEEFIPEGAESTEIKDRIVTIILDGEEVTVNVPAGVSILNSAIKADLDPPFSCKSGICTTCRSKLYSGKVRMDEREGLSDAEIEDGYILTCQSHPLTDDVKLEYM
ncbi:MAG: 2Fe-2S iron-sulfur cluster binding domain-containing protein [Ignavibacteria bacterium]|nr:2Fe-2S iron-sulfur cluster binding domain-containing protein [Ignavibacteria bacterium]